MVIPAMDHIDEHLATASLNGLYSPPVRVALAMGKAVLNKYYSLTDTSDLYRAAMGKHSFPPWRPTDIVYCYLVLHPRHKLQYFRNAGWPEEWVDTAKEIIYIPN
jgi:hypothetical protein